VLKSGADLLCFSGDKLFGGPQAGIIAGKKRFVNALKREPLFRALRCDKLCLAALQATVDLHLIKKSAKSRRSRFYKLQRTHCALVPQRLLRIWRIYQ
jgi:L-seryl-tRNA(Ser) seleniumtransferase